MTDGLDSDIKLSLRWRHTWPGERDDDFSGEAPTYTGQVGRIYFVPTGPMKDRRFWAMNANGYDILLIAPLSGFEISAKRAAAKAEAAWFQAIKGSTHELAVMPKAAPGEAYRRARDGE